MSDWTARIDALPKLPPDLKDEPCGDFIAYLLAIRAHYKAATALAAERLREPHANNCRTQFVLPEPCTCGKDADLARILEGK